MAIENIEIGTVTNDGKGERLSLAFDVANANFNELETGKENPLTFSSPLVRTVNTVSIPKASSGINGYLSGSDWNTFINKQSAITLTTTGTSGASTLVGSTLNIPQYNGGGSSGVHAQRIIKSGEYANLYLNYSSAPITGTAIQNRLYMMPFFPNQTITTQSLSINVTTLFAGGLTKILIFSDVDGSPTTKLYESADFDCSTTGIKTATTTFTFTKGTTYWISIVSNNGTNQFTFLPQASVYAFTGAAGFNGFTHNYTSVTYSAIPSTIAFFTGQGGNIPMVAIRKA